MFLFTQIKKIIILENAIKAKASKIKDKDCTSTDSSSGRELKARSNKARIFRSSFKRDKKSAYLQQ